MNNLNTTMIEGNLVKDAILLEPVEGFKVCKFSVAVNRRYKNKSNQNVEEVSFFNIESYGKEAEFCHKNGTKGKSIRVVGRLKQDTWKSESGKVESRVYIVAEHVEFKPNQKKNSTQQENAIEDEEPQAVSF